MNLYYAPGLKGNTWILSEEESWHVVKVMRYREGDIINLTDGIGNFFEAVLTKIQPKECEVLIRKTTQDSRHKTWNLHIGMALTKGLDRFECFLEKATEIGIDEVTPLICKHSERDSIKLHRLEKVMVAAMKQSLKAFLPKLSDPQKLMDFIRKPFTGQKFLAYCETADELELQRHYKRGHDVILLIGPEGDFSPDEVEAAKNHGFCPVSLGPSRLRTETAGIVGCHIINLINRENS